PDAARRIDVGGQAPARLVDDQLPAVGGLADDLVAGRQVHDHGGAAQGLKGAGGNGDPEVFADFHAEHQPFDVGGVEELGGGKGDGLAVQDDVAAAGVGRRGKPAP